MQRYFGIEKKEHEFFLEQGDYRHIKTVMRFKPGEFVEVVYHEQVFLCEITKDYHIIEKEKIEESSSFEPEVILILPLLKEQKMDYILQKATELGVSKIIPTVMERSVVKLEESRFLKKIERWTKICKEASEQSMRFRVPKIEQMHRFSDFSDLEGVKFLCSTREKTNNLKKFLNNHLNYDKMYIVVGPEGGLSLKEEQELVKMGFEAVSLGKRILRVETVPLFLLSILNYQNME